MRTLRAKDIPSLAGNKVATKEDYLEQVSITDGVKSPITLPKSNVLYYELENDSWCCVRPSGTEPKIKFYLGVKEDSQEQAEEVLDRMKKDILKNNI